MSKCFVSYSREQNDWMAALCSHLKQLGVDVFYDDDIPRSEVWLNTIQTEINKCSLFALGVTADSMASHWVRKELHTALANRKRIYPIILDAAPLPPFLANLQNFDLTEYDPKRYQELLADMISLLGMVPDTVEIARLDAPSEPKRLLPASVYSGLVTLIQHLCSPCLARDGLVNATRGVTREEMDEESFETPHLYASALIVRACRKGPNPLIAAQNLLVSWEPYKEDFGSVSFTEQRRLIADHISQLESPTVGARLGEDLQSSKYFDWLERKTQHLQLDAMAPELSGRISLDDVYIKERGVVSFIKQDVELGDITLERKVVPLINLVDVASKYQAEAIVLIGPAGSGKTTTLFHLANMIVRGDVKLSKVVRNYVPFFLPLKSIRPKKPGLAECFKEYTEREGLAKISEDFFDRNLKAGNCLVMLDGLDEIAEKKSRQQLVSWIEKARQDYPGNLFFITCREHVYRELHRRFDNNFLRVDVESLTQGDIQAFLEAWYEQIAEIFIEDDRLLPFENARIEANWLSHTIARRDEWIRLSANPLMLQIMAFVNLYSGTLPEHRADLYKQCITILAYGLDRFKRPGSVTSFDEVEVLCVLEQLAQWLHDEDGRTGASLEQLDSCLLEASSRTEILPRNAVEVFHTIVDRGALFVGSEGEVGFKHLAFQEYLVASGFSNEPELFPQLANNLTNPWWKEVIVLLLGHKRPPTFIPFMKELIKAGIFEKERILTLECVRAAAGNKRSPDIFVDLLCDSTRSFDCRYNAILALRETGLGNKRSQVENALAEDDSPIGRAGRLLLGLERRPQTIENGLPAFWRNPKDNMQYVLVPAGRFTMGAVDHDEQFIRRETPSTDIILDAYYIAIHPVTNRQYAAFIRETRHPSPKGRDPWNSWIADRYPPGLDHHPVVFVSWFDAKAYCSWSNCALPSEAQWEKAARGSDRRLFPWPDTRRDFKNLMNFDFNVSRTTEVGLYPEGASPYGCFDMVGNVWEWCEDWFNPGEYLNLTADTHNPTGPREGTHRVDRGGGWQMDSRRCRAAYRGCWLPNNPDKDLGFRTVVSVNTVLASLMADDRR